MFYVALTRAKSRCTLVWGRFKDAETSAPAYLFYPPASGNGNEIVDQLEQRIKGLSRRDFLSGPKEVEVRSGGAIKLMEMPVQPGRVLTAISDEKPLLTSKAFSRKISRQWSISSFSSLISGHSVSSERADYDALSLREASIGGAPDKSEGPEEEVRDIFHFPRGARAGTFMHELFENLDFAHKDPLCVKGLIAEKLLEYGFEDSWQGVLYEMIGRVLTTPLGQGQNGFQLSMIKKEERVNELAFYFPLNRISPEGLRDLFENSGHFISRRAFPERIGRLDFSPVKGFMRGFVDMVFRFKGRFFLVDWKSNFLGPRVEDYGREGLAQAMEGAFYILQYVIYTLALNQYLTLRLPDYDYERDFGGIFYIFLRGVDPVKGSDFGIYRDRPSEALIKDLCEALISSH